MTREEAAQALYAVKDELIERHFEFKGHVSVPITAIDMADEALKADPVRCKDCKWCDCNVTTTKASSSDIQSVEVDICNRLSRIVYKDWFCADGERREP